MIYDNDNNDANASRRLGLISAWQIVIWSQAWRPTLEYVWATLRKLGGEESGTWTAKIQEHE